MLTTTKIKWLGSIVLASVLLALAFMGGSWGKVNSADASVNADPIIYLVQPARVPVRSPDKIIVVSGLNFGGPVNTGVRLQGNNIDIVLQTIAAQDNGISALVTDILMTESTVYTLTVIRSDPGSVPSIPLVPPYDRESNPLTFTVYQAEEFFLPLIRH